MGLLDAGPGNLVGRWRLHRSGRVEVEPTRQRGVPPGHLLSLGLPEHVVANGNQDIAQVSSRVLNVLDQSVSEGRVSPRAVESHLARLGSPQACRRPLQRAPARGQSPPTACPWRGLKKTFDAAKRQGCEGRMGMSVEYSKNTRRTSSSLLGLPNSRHPSVITVPHGAPPSPSSLEKIENRFSRRSRFRKEVHARSMAAGAAEDARQRDQHQRARPHNRDGACTSTNSGP